MLCCSEYNIPYVKEYNIVLYCNEYSVCYVKVRC